jgi:hypothetical protein
VATETNGNITSEIMDIKDVAGAQKPQSTSSDIKHSM